MEARLGSYVQRVLKIVIRKKKWDLNFQFDLFTDKNQINFLISGCKKSFFGYFFISHVIVAGTYQFLPSLLHKEHECIHTGGGGERKSSK